MKELILEYLQEGIEISFRFDSPICKMVMIKYVNGHKFQNTKAFSIDQFADEFTVPDAMERCRFELEQLEHSHMNKINCAKCLVMGGCVPGHCQYENKSHSDEDEEPREKVKWQCVFCEGGGCDFGKCIMNMDK